MSDTSINPPLGFSQLQSALALADLDISVPETHGVVCGAICNQCTSGQQQDLDALIGRGADLRESRYDPFRETLRVVSDQALGMFQRRQSEFQLIMPPEQVDIHQRTEALADWCRGFTLALLHDGAVTLDRLPADAAEVVRDMLEIAQAETDDDDPEGDEWAFAEIEEYVRIGVQLLFEGPGNNTVTSPQSSREVY